MTMSLPKNRGIVLISVIFLTVLIGMYVASTLSLSRGQLAVANQTHEDRLAEQAARSGLEYALARLEENSQWRGDGNALVVNSPHLKVREDLGNVVGLIRSADGSVAQFRLRFNYQDGAGGGDARDNPTASMMFDSEHISVNNLAEPEEAAFPLGNGGQVTGYPVPAQSVALVCEGRVASEFGSFDETSLNPDVTRLQASRTLEGIYRIKDLSGSTPVEDAVSMAAKDVAVNLFDGDSVNPAGLTLSDASGNDLPKMRSRGDVSVRNEDGSDGDVLGPESQILIPTTNNLTANLASTISRQDEDLNSGFYQLAWDGVPTNSTSASELNAGVYVYWESDGQLHYYPDNYETYREKMIADPSFVTNPGETGNILPPGIEFVTAGDAGPDGVTSSKNRFVVSNDVEVVSPSGQPDTVDLSILPRGGAKEDIEGPGGGSGGPTPPGSVPTGVANLFPNITPQTTTNFGQEVFNGIQNSQNSGAFYQGPGENLHQLLSLIAPGGAVLATTNPQKAGTTIVWSDNIQVPPAFAGTGANGLLTRFVQENPDVFITGSGSNMNMAFLEPRQTGTGWKLRADALGAFIAGNALAAQSAPPEELDKFDLEQLSGGSVTSENLGPQDFEVTFVPQNETGIRMAGSGDFRIASDIRGSGASIKTEGQIRLVGLGFDIQANPGDEGPAISLYSKDDIVISTLQPDGTNGEAFTGLKLNGILYSWNDIELKTGSADEQDGVDPQKIHIRGAMVAYGGDPGVDDPGSNGRGSITMAGDQIELQFDPGYLLGLANGQGFQVTLAPVSQSYRR